MAAGATVDTGGVVGLGCGASTAVLCTWVGGTCVGCGRRVGIEVEVGLNAGLAALQATREKTVRTTKTRQKIDRFINGFTFRRRDRPAEMYMDYHYIRSIIQLND